MANEEVNQAVLETKLEAVEERLKRIEGKLDGFRNEFVSEEKFQGRCVTVNERLARVEKFQNWFTYSLVFGGVLIPVISAVIAVLITNGFQI